MVEIPPRMVMTGGWGMVQMAQLATLHNLHQLA